ncbi:MAG: hypothetical protein J6J31_12260 [Thermoguttaceae bacterium]|nr:hypothetical protein [Thermoguttaceae bacterium]
MNKLQKTILTVGAACTLAVTSFAAGNMISISVDPSVKILVNGTEFQPKDANGNDVMTFIYNGTTYAPLRALAEAYGLEVGYDAARNMATVSEPGKTYDTPAAPVQPSEKYGEGQYKVGKDIPAGTYMLWVSDVKYGGYFVYSSDPNADDIIENDSFATNSIIEVYDGEYLELRRCDAFPIKQAEAPRKQNGAFGEGFYIIGEHIPAGEYKLEITDEKYGGYYCIYNDVRRNDIDSNGSFTGSRYISLSEGQYLKLNRCKIIVD